MSDIGRSSLPTTDKPQGKKKDDSKRPTISGLLANRLSPLVPPWIRQFAISVSIVAPAEAYQGSTVQFAVQFRNRLPLPLEIETGLRPWYWHIDGVHDADASEPDPAELPDDDGTMYFSPFEIKTIQRSWNGRIRHEPSAPFVLPDRGKHELTVEIITKRFRNPKASHIFSIRQEPGF